MACIISALQLSMILHPMVKYGGCDIPAWSVKWTKFFMDDALRVEKTKSYCTRKS